MSMIDVSGNGEKENQDRLVKRHAERQHLPGGEVYILADHHRWLDVDCYKFAMHGTAEAQEILEGDREREPPSEVSASQKERRGRHDEGQCEAAFSRIQAWSNESP